MTWYAVYSISTGRLASISEAVADDSVLAASGLTKAAQAERPDLQHVMWDEVLKVFVPRPVKVPRDLVEELLADPTFPSMNAAAKDKIRQLAQRVFANFRFQ